MGEIVFEIVDEELQETKEEDGFRNIGPFGNKGRH